LPSDLIAAFAKSTKTPPSMAGFFVAPFAAQLQSEKQKGREIPAPSFSFHQLRKQRRPYGPECQPGGQLYIGRQPPAGPRCQPGPQPPATGMVAAPVTVARSSGATGMAWEAGIDARPIPIANKEAASIFIGIPSVSAR
jgi:hypothetical protein